MRVLYVGSLDSECSTCYSRFCALQILEPDTHGFNTIPYLSNWPQGNINRIHQTIETHLLRGQNHSHANADLITKCRELRPDIVWIDTGVWVWPDTIRELKRLGSFLVMHITDALVARHWRVRLKRRLLQQTLKLYDVFFTSNVDDYQAKLATAPPTPLLTDLGYDDQLFTPEPLLPERAKNWETPIIFIGHYEPATEAGILALIDAGLPVKVYGHAPWFKSPNREKLGNRLQPSLNNDDYASALKGAAIGLCFLSVLNYNQTAGRSFEIPGSGTFLLAVRTPQHLACYEEGIEAEFFSNHEELILKAKYYLEHPTERETIALKGLQRCQKSGYSWNALMARDWPKVLQIYSEQKNT